MLRYPYLLKYLQRGDRILLYARGVNGRNIYSFLKNCPQFHVIGFVDRNADSVSDTEIPVYRPDQLKTIPADSYDRIVITVFDQRMGYEIYQIIRESEVTEDKIVAPYTYLGPFCTLSVSNILQDPARLQQELKIFIGNPAANRAAYFEPLLQELAHRKSEKDRLLLRFREIARSLMPLEKVIFLYILFLAGIFDAGLMKSMMECLLKIDQQERRLLLHGMFIESSLMCFLNQEYLLPEFYNMRRALLMQVCGMYNLRMKAEQIQERKDGKRNKVCILTHILYDQTSSPTQLSIQLSGTLADLGYEVTLMPLDVCCHMALENPVFSPIRFEMYGDSREYEAYHKKTCHPRVAVEYTDGFELREKMQLELDKLAAFSPDLIIDMTDEFSILSYVYSQYFPTLYLPLRGYQSSSFFTYFGVRDRPGFQRENWIYHSVDESCTIDYPAFYILPPAPEQKRVRRELSLMEGDFVLVTVGGRLNVEMTEEFVDMVCGRLLDKPNIKWLVVGSGNEYLSQNYAELIEAQKVIYIPYEDDLPALYDICDLYLNPKRMGAGTSIVWAMHAGLPAAVLSCPCDAMTVIGYENAAGDTYEQMMEYVLDLWRDPTHFAHERKKFRRLAVQFENDLTQKVQTAILQIESLENGKGR